jgi:hypothetical protein
MFEKIISWFRPKTPYKYEVIDIKASGCIFTNKSLILAGYQPNKELAYISGIGGHREDGEEFQQTAFRETLEELFNVNTFPKGLLEKIEKTLVPQRVIKNEMYAFILLTFKDLEEILRICKRYRLRTPLYKKFPLTLNELIFNRILDPTAEITHFSLIPMIKNISIDPYFVEDIGLI